VGDGAFTNPFSWHRAACSTNAALDLQCRSPRSTSGKEPGDTLEHAEVREAKDHAVVRTRGSRPSRRRAMVITQAGLGLRVAELLALRVQDVDFLRRTVRVEFQTPPDGKYRVPPKTPRSRRALPLSEVVGKALAAAHIGEFPPTEDGSLFTTANGNLYRHEHYGARIFCSICEEVWVTGWHDESRTAPPLRQRAPGSRGVCGRSRREVGP
jgi:integrase